MNLQPVDNKKHRDADKETWRNSHIIRFSQIDGAGIVYYPRYFEMLVDSFPQQFALTRPARFDISFHHPARLGEELLLELNATATPSESVSSKNTATDTDFEVTGKSADELCFALSKSNLDPAADGFFAPGSSAFIRQVEIRDWMTGKDGRMHTSRCYELTAVLMEEWFSKSLGCPFATTQSTDGVLVPTVKLQTDIRELPSQNDIVQVSLVVLHIGQSSLGLGMTVSRNGQLLVQSRQTIVFVAFKTNGLSSVPIPAQLIPELQNQLIEETS